MKIAFFDSGIGGLTVLKEAMKLLPNEKYIYYADTLNAPYGTKSKEEVMDLTLAAVRFLSSFDIKALVIACNTATSIAIDTLRKEFDFPIVGMEPALKVAVEKDSTKRILVFATPLTLKEDKFNSLVDRLGSKKRVDMLPAQKLIEFAESCIFDGDEVIKYLQDILSGFDMEKYSSIVLGCTHYTYFKDAINKVTDRRHEILDGNAGTARQLVKVLANDLEVSCKFELEGYISGRLIDDMEIFKKYLNCIK